MTAKTAAALGSFLLVAVAGPGCVSFYEIPVETPIHAKLDVSSFQRVLVAGFLAGGSKSLDPEYGNGAAASQPAPHQVRPQASSTPM